MVPVVVPVVLTGCFKIRAIAGQTTWREGNPNAPGGDPEHFTL